MARELANRARDRRPWESYKERLTTYNETTKALYQAGTTFPPPNEELNRAQATALGQLQTRTYPNPAQYHRFYPCAYPTDICKVSRTETATLIHMLWDCKKNPNGANSGALPPWWAAALRSPSLGDQLWPVQHAREVAKRQDLDVPTWET